MATQAQRREDTRARIIKAAREYFSHYGFDGTHTSEILAQANVSRGGMYHHFPSKNDLFEAVFIAVSNETIAYAVRNGKQGQSAKDYLISACLAWLKVMRMPANAAILLDQGPRVLGWKRARDLEARSSLSLMKKSVRAAVKSGELEVVSVELAAKIINAVLAEIALAHLYDQSSVSVKKQEIIIRQLIEGMSSQ